MTYKEQLKEKKRLKQMELLKQREYVTRILSIKAKYKREYDELFDKIMKATKGSIIHIELLRKEAKLEARTRKLTRDNGFVFWEERRRIFESMEQKGAFGDRPRWEDDKEGFRHYEGRPHNEPEVPAQN